MKVYYGGEDTVTKLIAKRLIQYVAEREGFAVTELEDANPRDYGAKALDKLEKIIRLSSFAPIVCVFDSDSNCVLDLLKKHIPDEGWKKARLAVNIAIDEGETWLMADRAGFAAFFGLDHDWIPQKPEGTAELSLSMPYKTSLYFLDQMVPHSRKEIVLEVFAVRHPGRKPPTYNSLWPDFIANHWNIEQACGNSESLARSIARIQRALQEEEDRHSGKKQNKA